MELAFTKLFNKIVTSSVWSEDDKTRIMWITMLALSDRNGYVAAALPGLADVSRMSLEDAEKAIKKLESPDQYSRTKLYEGKRIIPVEGGWEIVTYDIHRQLLSAEERKQYKAAWIKKRRQKSRQMSTTVDTVSTLPSASAYLLLLKSERVRERFKKWIDVRKAQGRKPKDWDAMFSEQCEFLKQFNESDQLESISASIRNNWQGLFPPKEFKSQKPSAYKTDYTPKRESIFDE